MKHSRNSRIALIGAPLLLVCLPTLAGVRVPPLTLTTLMRKHVAATTVPGSRPARTQKTIYALDAEGMSGTLTEYDALPHQSRVEMVLGPVRQISADNGKTAWEQDMSGHVRFLSGPELAEDRSTASFSLESYDPLRGSKGGRVTLRAHREPGTGDYILDLAPAGGIQQTAYLDPRTYLLQKMIVVKGGITGTVKILAYQRVSGEQVPAQMQITYAGLPIVVTAHLVEAQRDLPVSAALFAPPPAARDFVFLTPTGNGPVTIPYTVVRDEIVIPVTINGQTRRMLLDSGAGSSFLTADAAKGMDLTTAGSVPAIGYGGATKTGVATHATLELPGSVRIQNQTLYVIQDPSAAQILAQRGIDGALGYDLFSRFAITIDFQQKTLTLADPAGPLPGGGTTLPLRLETRTPNVLATIDGRKPARFLIDTGDNGAVLLFQKYASDNGLLPAANDPRATQVQGVGIGGAVTQTVTPGHTLTLGGLTLTGVPLATVGGGGITDVLSQAGGIGDAVLQKFVVTFNYTRSSLVLQKAPGYTSSLVERPFIQRPFSCALPRLTLTGLLHRHLEALGGAVAVSAIKSTRVTANVKTGGTSGTVVTVFAVPDREFEEDKIGILDIMQGYDGNVAWRRDTNGNIRTLGIDELKNLRNQLFFDTNSYVIPGRIHGTMTLRVNNDSKTGDYIVDAVPEGGKPTTLFFDPKTFLIVKEQHLDDNVLVATTYEDYKTVDGVKFPFHQLTTNGNSRYDISLQTTSLQNNVQLAANLFNEPAEGGKSMFVTTGTTSATVPFDFSDGEVALDVTINGQSERVFLDSGASGIALSKATADALKLPQSGYLEARGYGGSADLTPVKVSTFEVPNAVRLSDIAAVSIPLPASLSSSLTQPVAGFVGYDLLSHFVVRVDYPKRQITFMDPDAFHPSDADGPSLPIELDNDIPTIVARLDGLPPARYLVDTGDSGFLRLYGPYVLKNKLDSKYPSTLTTAGGGIGGTSYSRVARVGSFTVAGMVLHGVPTDFSLDTKGGASQVNAGSVGSALLARFAVTFDYPHGRIFLTAGTDAVRPFDTRTSGLSVRLSSDQKQMLVTAVGPNTPAANAGIQVNDEIVTIDGKPALTLGLQGVRSALSGGDGRTSHTLVVQALLGQPRTVKVSLFDPLPDMTTTNEAVR